MKAFVRRWLHRIGYDLVQHNRTPARQNRLVGRMDSFLEDVAARGLEVSSILDVGGHCGDWAAMARSAFPRADVLILEPQQQMKPSLDAFCAANPGCRWKNAAAGAAPGELTFHVWDDDTCSSFLPSVGMSFGLQTRPRTVPVVTIDALLESGELKPPQVVKIDTQGFELEVLKGGSRLFGTCELFILEATLIPFLKDMPPAHEVLGFMLDRGYVLYDIAGTLRRPLDGALTQLDLCFVPETGFLRRDHRYDAATPAPR